MTAEDVYEMLRKIRYDLTAAQGKLTDVFSMLGELNLQDTPAHVCDRCGVKFRASTLLAEHVYNSHAGPEPEHWKRIEEISAPSYLESGGDRTCESSAAEEGFTPLEVARAAAAGGRGRRA